MSHRTGNDSGVLSASAASTATNTGATPVGNLGGYAAMVFILDVTAAATDVGDTLNVFIQTKGHIAEWLDVAHFTEVLGNGGAKTFVTKIETGTAVSEYETGTALAAAAARDIMGDTYRVRWDIVDSDADGSFTFSVTYIGMAA